MPARSIGFTEADDFLLDKFEWCLARSRQTKVTERAAFLLAANAHYFFLESSEQ